MSERGRVALVFLVLTLAWGSTWAAIRIVAAGMPPLAGVSARFTIAGIALLIWARATGRTIAFGRREWKLWCVNALLTFVASYGLIYWAGKRLPSGLASVIFASFPLWIAVLAPLFLPEEKSRAGQWIGVALGFAGMALLYSEDLDGAIGAGATVAAVALGFSPLLSAVASLAMKRWGKGLSPASLSAMPMLLAGVALAPLSALFERDAAWSGRPEPWIATVYLALVGSALTFPLYFWLLERRSAVTASLVSYTAPVVAVLLGAFAFDERLTLRLATGALTVLVGVAVALRSVRE